MALSDLAVFSQFSYSAMTEVLRQQIDLFNAATNGAIVLRAVEHVGDYSDEAHWAKISGLVRRRNPYGSGTVTAKNLAQLVDTMVKVAAGTPPVNIPPGMFEWINRSPEEGGAVIGRQLAIDTLADMLNTSIMAGVAALSGVAAVVTNGSTFAKGTLSPLAIPLDTETVTIGGKVYTFQTVLTNVNGNVLIGASATTAMANLASAINLTAGAGTTYATAMTIHPTVSANGGNPLILTAKTAGLGGNGITTTETLTNGSFGAATLTGGANSGNANQTTFNTAQALFGDAYQDILVWVMHSKPLFDIYGGALENSANLFTFGNVNVRQDGFGRSFVISDSPSLVTSATPPLYYTLGLTANGLTIHQQDDFTDNISTLNGDENILRTYQAEWSYELGVKGFAWDKTNGGKAPNDAALAVATNWDRFATSHKDLAGVLVQTL